MDWLTWQDSDSEPKLMSADAGIRLEGEVADYLGERVVQFQKNIFRVDGSKHGEIDVEVAEALIEVASGFTGKSGQIQSKYFHPRQNPKNKPVIVYAPRMRRRASMAVENVGAIIVRNFQELEEVLELLGRRAN